MNRVCYQSGPTMVQPPKNAAERIETIRGCSTPSIADLKRFVRCGQIMIPPSNSSRSEKAEIRKSLIIFLLRPSATCQSPQV